jgi:hypothetical protein
MESMGTPSCRKGSADHCNSCKHKQNGYADVGGSQEYTCRDSFDQTAATSEMTLLLWPGMKAWMMPTTKAIATK